MQKDVRVKLKKDLEKIYLQYAKHSDEEERLAFMNELACKAKQVAPAIVYFFFQFGLI